MVVGINGKKVEVVFGLTDVAKAQASTASPSDFAGAAGPGATMRYSNGFLVIDTTTSALNLPGISAH